MNQVFIDGGVIGLNPSKIGGTWACRVLEDDVIVKELHGYITVQDSGMHQVTNNLTEMLALVSAMEYLPKLWIGTIYSDSQITIGRAVQGWAWNNIPKWLYRRFDAAKFNHSGFHKWKWVLLQGHPTKADLLKGTGSKGYPVSIHNVWCDLMCKHEATQYMSTYIPEK